MIVGFFFCFNFSSQAIAGGPPASNWTGNVDSNWENPSNWAGASVPSSGTDIIIDLANYSGAMAHPSITVISSFSPKKLNVQFGGQLSISSILAVTQDFTVDNNNSGTTTSSVVMSSGTLVINSDKSLKLKKGGNFTLTGGLIIITKDLSVEEGATFTMSESTGTSSVVVNSDGNNKGKLKIKGKNGNSALLNLLAGTITINAGQFPSLEIDGSAEGATTYATLNMAGGVLTNYGPTQFKGSITDNTKFIVSGGTATLSDNIEVRYKKGAPSGRIHIAVNNGTLKIQKELILYTIDSLIQTGGTIIFENANNFPNNGAVYATGGTTIFQGSTTLTGTSVNWQFHNVTIDGTLNQAAIGNINVSGDLIHNGTYTHNNQTITFNNSSTSQTIQSSSTLEFYNVTVNSSNTVNLSSGNFNLRSTLTLANGVFNPNGLLTILSDATGTARIAEITGGSITGDIIMQRYIDAGSTNWRFITSPINGATLADLNDDFITSGFTGSDFPLWPTAANPWASIYFYDESQPGIMDSGFVAATNTSNSLAVGEGLWVWSGDTITGTQPFTIDITGPANTGNINLPLSYTNSGFPADDGWNMVGNPYPSTMDWDDLTISKTGINNAIYIWNPDLQQFASYVGGFGTNGGSKNIASSQAFWVQTTAVSASVQVTEASKTSIDGAFLKPGNPVPLIIDVTNSFGTDQTIINFEANATNNFDASFDALKMISVSLNLPAVYTLMLDSIELSINQLPEQEIDIPLKITSGLSGIHQIDFSGISNFSFAGCLMLEDLFTGSVYDLNNISSITTFIYDTTQTARFLIKFGARIDVTTTNVSCYGNNDGDILFEKNSPNTFDVVWKDNLGNVIANNTNITVLDGVSSLSPGTYTIETSDNTCGNRIDTVIITEPNQIVAQFITSADTIHLSNGGNITFTNQSSDANYYNWDFDDLSTSSLTSPTHQYTQVGNYFVTLDASQNVNCYETVSKTITVLNMATSIIEAEQPNSAKIWLNAGQLQINGTDIDKIEIRNIIGQLLLVSDLNKDQQTINLENISSQALLVTVISKNKPSSTKVNYIKN